jgi:stage V sporulation protein AE
MEYIKCFITGGIICVVAQILIDKTKLTPARIVVLFVTIGVILSGLGIYQKIVDFGGEGATIPIMGFGHSLAKGIRKAVDEKGLIGIFTGGVTATSAGITAAVIFGYLAGIFGKSQQK